MPRPHQAARSRRRKDERQRERDEAPSRDKLARQDAKARFSTPAVRRLLEGIGTPEPAPLTPDRFQLEALAALEHEDVLVTAPTGSGKTWIAREEIRRLLAAGRRAWYTSPLKALTNSKYAEFAEIFGSQNVGILTGDRKENADAPLIVGTTEIYRNQLFDALRSGAAGSEIRADLVVMDEAHYLADEERGHVWEEAIILTPPRVRLLLLSATIGNAAEFASWIAEVRGHVCGVVTRSEEGGARPVPLRAAFLYPEGHLLPLFDNAGHFNSEITHFVQQAHARQAHLRGGSPHRAMHASLRLRMPEMPPATLLSVLSSYHLLPAIVFLPTRRRCDEAAAEAALAPVRTNTLETERREARRRLLREFAAQHPEVLKHRHREMLVRSGVASHHAGHLPAWKLVVEQLMSAGLLDAIFATATVAAGVDFPARTVALTGVEVRTGRGWRSLTASELQQMTGRAGRRGRDHVGFIVAAPGMYQDPLRMAALLRSPPEPLESRFRATYTTLLNLTDAYGGFTHVREIVERSFAHREAVEQIARLERERDSSETSIEQKLKEAGCARPASAARGLERLVSARSRLLEGAPQTRAQALFNWLDEMVVPGRIVAVGRSGRRLIFVTERRGSSFIGVREDGRRAALALERAGRVSADVYPLAEEKREAAFEDARSGRATFLREPRLREARSLTDDAVTLINDLIESFSASGVEEEQARCERALWSAMNEAGAAQTVERRIESLRAGVWLPFEQHARVLDHFGYLNFVAERVTERGRWLADLRLDRPLLVGEAIERKLFASLDAPRCAALMAASAADPERDYGDLPLDDALVVMLARFDQVAYEVGSIEWQYDLEPAPEINFTAAAAAARWAGGVKWSDLVHETRAEEGDLFRMLSRTGESLLQIGALRRSHAEAAEAAERAAQAILRAPVRPDEF